MGSITCLVLSEEEKRMKDERDYWKRGRQWRRLKVVYIHPSCLVV